MSDCSSNAFKRYEHPEVMRGKLVFDDGTELPLTFARHNGRRVDHFTMDGERYERVAGAGGRCTNPDERDCGRDCGGCEFYERVKA